jgi:hypothetical protein
MTSDQMAAISTVADLITERDNLRRVTSRLINGWKPERDSWHRVGTAGPEWQTMSTGEAAAIRDATDAG